MAVVGVDAAGPDQADRRAAGRRPGAPRSQAASERRPLEERAVGDRGVDPRQVLEHRPAGAEVEVADLGVAHLAGRQPDGLLRRLQDGVRPAREQAAPGRHPRRGDRVVRRVGADPEAVEDDEDDRPRSAGHAGPAGSSWPARERSRRRGRRSPAISSGLSEAPPTSAPSIAGSARNSPMFAAVTLPP